MLHKKLLEVLQRLSVQELKMFRQFIQSPYFVSDRVIPTILTLFDYLEKSNFETESPRLEKRIVSQLIFPNHQYVEKKKGPIDDYSSLLFNLAKKFISLQSFENGNASFQENLSLAKFYRKHSLDERYWQIMKSTENQIKSIKNRDFEYYYNIFLCEEEKNMFLGLYNAFKDDANINNTIKSLDLYYVTVRNDLLSFLSFQNQQMNKPSKVSKEYFDWFDHLNMKYNILEKEPLSSLYYHAFLLLQDPGDENNNNEFIKKLENNKKAIPYLKYRDLKAIERILWHYRYYNKPSKEVLQGLFNTFKLHFEEGLLFFEDKIMVNGLRTLVLLSLKVDEYDFAYRILNEFPAEKISGTQYPGLFKILCQVKKVRSFHQIYTVNDEIKERRLRLSEF